MTLHSKVEYKCTQCETRFVPIPEAPQCPKCGAKSDTVFPDFIQDALKSTQFNLNSYGMWMKMWMTLTIGDWYYYVAFNFLGYACKELGEDKWHFLFKSYTKQQADELASQYYQKLCKRTEPYWEHGLPPYLSLLLQTKLKQPSQ